MSKFRKGLSMAMLPERKIYVVNPMPAQISAAQRQALLALDTGTIGHHLEAGFMDGGMIPRIAGSKIAGTAVTVRITVPDSVMAHYALKFTRPGDILVIDRGQDQRTANWGAATIYAAALTGLEGVLVDGAVNDIEDARQAGLPLWSRSLSPVTTKYRGLGGEFNVPVSCGGVAVSPGDAILADDNGVVVIPQAQLDETLAGSLAWFNAEQAFIERLRKNPGLCYPDETGATELVERSIRAQDSSSG
jgi:regulator of RNase E activity RraA